jgi:GNAT superfamily N-acetyltransferase
MSDADVDPAIRTATAADLPELQRVYEAASLSNAGDAPLLRAHPEYLVFAGDGIAAGRTRVEAVGSRVLGFATVIPAEDGELELEDLFTDPARRRQGVARRLIADAVSRAGAAGYQRLSVTGNPHALDFYRAVGFVEVGELATPLGQGLRLRLGLTPASLLVEERAD